MPQGSFRSVLLLIAMMVATSFCVTEPPQSNVTCDGEVCVNGELREELSKMQRDLAKSGRQLEEMQCLQVQGIAYMSPVLF